MANEFLFFVSEKMSKAKAAKCLYLRTRDKTYNHSSSSDQTADGTGRLQNCQSITQSRH